MVYGINDASDRRNDLDNDRKGNFLFGPKGWSRNRLTRVLVPGMLVGTFLPLFYWGWTSHCLLPYMIWFLVAVLVNYWYNFQASAPWTTLGLVWIGYASVTLLSYWRHSGNHGEFGIRLDDDTNNSHKWYMAGCNQDYWMHLSLLLVRSQLWTELLDYDSDRRMNKWTTLSRLPTKAMARQVVLAVLVTEAIWSVRQYQQEGSDWSTLLAFSCMGVILFGTLEFVLPPTTKQQQAAPAVDLVWLAMMQNAGGIYLLHDCW
eukprot:CAMPEP_0119016262 /NCGR_PEP_ID=MMETSP1176-20130426/11902_1 /TAXON_ID=265551 /ORGANISM="Synedropsis recta cf, Strain CCMP1620" /LENGTH=259 /DNA_ID=CAMNT_0006969603 /DNA_START=245 /DNA_END=1021 /DNA_ORIENTATION=-